MQMPGPPGAVLRHDDGEMMSCFSTKSWFLQQLQLSDSMCYYSIKCDYSPRQHQRPTR